MRERVTFKIFEFDRFGCKKFKDITLNITTIKTIDCGGGGCLIYYKNGKSKLLYWYDDSIKKMLDDETLGYKSKKIFWFDDETYNIFWEWYKQFPFDEINEKLDYI